MTNSGRSLLSLSLLALAVKAIVLVVDPNPQFFMGDSASYIATALVGWIPPDRSYLYGFVIRWLSLGSESLFSLVLVQTIASAFSAGLLGWNLRRFLEISPRLATFITIAYSLDPLQLMYERFVMAETFSLLAAMGFISLLLLFVDTGRKRYLVWAIIAGLISVAFRISFLPPVTALSFSAPFLRLLFKSAPETNLRQRLKPFLTALAVVFVSSFAIHTSYKFLTGYLVKAPPAYQYADGHSLLSSWAPLLTPQDLTTAGVSPHIFDGSFPNHIHTRRAQRWMKGGFVAILKLAYPNALEANAVAKDIAFQILKRDPIGVTRLAVQTYFRGWRSDVIAACIREDTGMRPIPPQFANDLSRHFHLAAADLPTSRSFTKSYFDVGIYWYRTLLLTPLLLVGTAFAVGSRYRAFFVCVAIFAVVVMLIAVGLAVDNSIRYLHPLGWTFFVFAAYWLNFLLPTAGLGGARSARPASLGILSILCFVLLLPVRAKADSSGGRPGLYVSNGVLMRQGKPYHGIGANYNTLFGQLLQNKDNTSSLDKLARLGKAGIPFVRFRASGFGPENQVLYLTNRAEFFRRMDQVVHCAEQNQIGLIPSLFWRLATVSEVVGERRDRLGSPDGKANAFIIQFTREMVKRYKDSPAIWGWEFGNEANLGVDLPNAKAGNRVTSDQLRTVYTLFAQTVREIDPTRIIEPGTTLPRPNAWQLAHGRRGRPDNAKESLSTLFMLAPDPMNMVSAHVYERGKTAFAGTRGLGEVLSFLTKSAAARGKPLFLGEFPVRNRSQTKEFLEAIKASRVPLSAFWVFDQPSQEATMNVDFNNKRSFVLDLVVQANRDLASN